MLNDNLQDEILVKTKEGDFKLLKNSKLIDIVGDELMVKEDEIVKVKEENKPRVDLGKTTSNFYFDVDDEHEAIKLSNKNQEERNRTIKEFIETTVRNIIGSAGLAESLLENLQLKNIILSRLKDVRSLAETKEALMCLSGQNPLSTEQIGRLLKSLETKRDEVEEVIRTGKLAGQQLKAEPVREVEVRPRSKVVEQKEDKQVDMAGVEYKKFHEVVKGDELSSYVTTGPVEEIRKLSLEDFRRLGANPKEAADRVHKKIDLLGDESLTKKAEGVKAWHESEVYKLYLAIGAASMAEKKPIEQVIREYKEASKPYLAPEEFNGVADLNRKLSY